MTLEFRAINFYWFYKTFYSHVFSFLSRKFQEDNGKKIIERERYLF